MSNPLVVISKNTEDLAFAQEVAKRLGSEIFMANSSKEGWKLIQEKILKKPLLFVDVSDEEAAQEFIKVFKTVLGQEYNVIPSRLVNLIVAEQNAVNPELLSHSNLYDHVILREFSKAEESAEYYCNMVMDWICDKSAPVVTAFQTLRQIRITHSDQKAYVLDKIQEFLVRDNHLQDRMAQSILSAIDELLMNAVYDAPEERLGVSFPRETPFNMTRENSVELHIKKDGDWVGFTVIDQHGSISRDKLMCRIFKNRFFETGHLDLGPRNEGGSGLGLASTLKKGGSLTFFCKKGVRTEVTVAFRLSNSYKTFKHQLRTVSVYNT